MDSILHFLPERSPLRSLRVPRRHTHRLVEMRVVHVDKRCVWYTSLRGVQQVFCGGEQEFRAHRLVEMRVVHIDKRCLRYNNNKRCVRYTSIRGVPYNSDKRCSTSLSCRNIRQSAHNTAVLQKQEGDQKQLDVHIVHTRRRIGGWRATNEKIYGMEIFCT